MINPSSLSTSTSFLPENIGPMNRLSEKDNDKPDEFINEIKRSTTTYGYALRTHPIRIPYASISIYILI